LRIAAGGHDLHVLKRCYAAGNLRKCRLIHSHVDPWFVGQCRLAHQRGGPRWVHTYHTLYFPSDWGGSLEDWQREVNDCLLGIAHEADVCISVSKWLQSLLKKEHGIETLYVPNGVDVTSCESARPAGSAGRLPTEGFALFVGSAAAIKNPMDFVDLAHRFSHVPFVMAGSGLSSAELHSTLGSGFPRNLTALGALPHGAVLDAIAACRVFVLTSHSEGLPTVLMEAMALGKTVVASDCPGAAEVIGGPECGYTYRRGSGEALADVFREAWTDPSKGEVARERAYDVYDWRVVAPQLDEIYRSLLA